MGQSQASKDQGAARARLSWAAQAADRAAGAQRALEATPDFALNNAKQVESIRKTEEDAQKTAANDLTTALSKQKAFANKAQGKGGTILTGALGVVGADQAPGQKQLLGI